MRYLLALFAILVLGGCNYLNMGARPVKDQVIEAYHALIDSRLAGSGCESPSVIIIGAGYNLRGREICEQLGTLYPAIQFLPYDYDALVLRETGTRSLRDVAVRLNLEVASSERDGGLLVDAKWLEPGRYYPDWVVRLSMTRDGGVAVMRQGRAEDFYITINPRNIRREPLRD
jgi:hypothetical protein